MCIYLIFDISYYIILVAVDNFRYLCIVLCQLQHLNYFIVYILFDNYITRPKNSLINSWDRVKVGSSAIVYLYDNVQVHTQR